MHPMLSRVMRRVAWLAVAVWLAAATGPASAAETVTYYYTDPQGTVIATADAAGNLLTTTDYRPFGIQALGSATAGPGYTGHVNDPDSGLVYMQARYYDPTTGRFLSADPVGPTSGSISQFNRFAYTSNNPINHVDPDGRCVEDLCIGETSIALGAGVVYVTAATLVAVGACVAACEKVQNAISSTAKSVYDHLTFNKSQDSQRPTKTPNNGEPGTRYKNPGSGQEREYGDDGKPIKDVDYDHDHGQGQPHVHDWGRDSNGKPVRGPGRPVNPQTEPDVKTSDTPLTDKFESHPYD